MNDEPDDKAEVENTALNSDIQEKLGAKLKEVYADVVNEPVPERFIDLLNKLEKSTPDGSGKN